MWKSVLFQRQTVPSTPWVPGTFPRTRDASFHPTPPPLPIPSPSPPFLRSTSCPHLQAYGSLPPPPVHWPRGCSALVFAFVSTAYSWKFYPPNKPTGGQSQVVGGGAICLHLPADFLNFCETFLSLGILQKWNSFLIWKNIKRLLSKFHKNLTSLSAAWFVT